MLFTFRPATALAARFPRAQRARILLQDTNTGDVLWSAQCTDREEARFDPDEHNASIEQARIRIDVLIEGAWTKRVVNVRLRNVLRSSRLQVFAPTNSSADVNAEFVSGISVLDWIEFPHSLQRFVGAYNKLLRSLRAAKTPPFEAEHIVHLVQAYEETVGFIESSRYANLLYVLRFYAELNIAEGRSQVKVDRISERTRERYVSIAQQSPRFPAALLVGGFCAVEGRDYPEAQRLFDESWAVSQTINRTIGLMKSGPATFSSASLHPVVAMDPEFDLSRRSQKDVTIVFSANVAYLRKYAMRVAFQMVVVRDCAYHFHLIDTEQNVERFLADFEDALDMCRRMRQSDAPRPSWSWSREDLPSGITNEKTYFACARYVHLRRFLEVLGGDIWVQDADSYLSSSPDKWIARFRDHDVAVTCGSTFDRFIPWFAYLGFSTFVSNTEPGRSWTAILRRILLSKLSTEESWLLDQTALFLAIGEAREPTPVLKILPVGVDDSIVSHFHSSLAQVIEGPQ